MKKVTTFKQALNVFVPKIQAELRRVVAPPVEQAGCMFMEGQDVYPTDEFYGMLHYHLGWVDEKLQPLHKTGGKLLRPVFTMLTCQACGASHEKALTAAAAVELVHNFTLIHDDIQDNSDTRRGRTTVWKIWGQPQAINAGDTMFIIARNALLDLPKQGVPFQTTLEAINTLDHASLALCKGQYLDMSFEKRLDINLSDYLDMIKGKTGALLGCAGYLGGLIATDSPQKATIFKCLGETLGSAFQIQDDWLGIWGRESVTGKPAADDLRNRKKSLPVVFALNQIQPPTHLMQGEGSQTLSNQFREIYAADMLTETDIATAVTLLEEMGAKTYMEAQAKHYAEKAYQILQNIEASSEDIAILQEMTQFFVKRMY